MCGRPRRNKTLKETIHAKCVGGGSDYLRRRYMLNVWEEEVIANADDTC